MGEEPYFRWDQLANNTHFGLAEAVGKPVKEYYDLVFENVGEFIQMNHEEIRGYEEENRNLAAMLDDKGLERAERDSILEEIEKNRERIGDIEKSLDSRLPVDIDAFRHGVNQVNTFFPKVAEQYEEYKRGEYNELLRDDPIRLQGDLVAKYSIAYVADAGERLFDRQRGRDAYEEQLRWHTLEKPDWLKNLVTLGNAGDVWKEQAEHLRRGITGCETEIAELLSLRAECKAAWLSEPAREYAKAEINAQHPEVHEACERHMARHWEQKNEARLEKQVAREAERDGEGGKNMADGISR